MLKQVMIEPKKEEESVADQIQRYATKAKMALKELEDFNQEQIDHIVHQMALAGLNDHMRLAKLAVEETKRGVYEDKCIKNMFATESIWHDIKTDKTVGVIHEDDQAGLMTIASPVGVICGVTPVTNPTSTTMFKALVALKTRNPIIFAFHPSAQQSSAESARVLYEAAIKAGAPLDCIQWIENPSLKATNTLMNHPDVAIVLATGGSGMVKSAYSTGKPALGVGPGNVPSYIEKTANIKRAVNDIILSKTFDNGMICASEQAVIVDQSIYEEVKTAFKRNQVYFVPKKELALLEETVMNESKTAVNPAIVGQSADTIAEMAGLKAPKGTKILMAELDGVGAKYPLSREKLSPVLAMLKAETTEHGFELCQQMLELGGLGHSAAIHTNRMELAESFSTQMKAGRIIVNSPSSQGGIGDIYNNMMPSLTLGCGSYGQNSVSTNVSAIHLVNIKTVSKRRNNMQWFKLPPKIYFEKNSVQYLQKMPNIKRAFLVCDPGMVEFGYASLVEKELSKRSEPVEVRIFSNVEPNPSIETVERGTAAMREFQPDTIIALGGGSAMDAAKGMWLFYEQPEADFNGAKQKFMDIRKRTYKIPELKKTTFVAIPTTSGTGSEVTPFTVITDNHNNVKYPLADYALTPDVAIIDSQFVMTVPKSITADTGMDVLTHAIESYVSVMASDYTKGLSLQAIKLVFDYLEESYTFATEIAREKMHNASTLAGMAFANAFLGINHSLAHKIGAEFEIPHGRANAILMPHVIRYNAKTPSKFQLFPKYEYFRADEDYAEIARYIGVRGNTTEELVEALVQKIMALGKTLNIQMSMKAQGVTQQRLDQSADRLAELAFEDQCTTANPKEPLISELKDILYATFEGE